MTLTPLNPNLHVPLTYSQRARLRRPTPKPMSMPTDAEIDTFFARPRLGDIVAAAQPGTVSDEVDAGYLAAIRLSPRPVGHSDGQVPSAVAWRLFEAGLIRRVE